MAGDDACQLYLSTDDNPANKQPIASVSGYTNYGEWNKYSTQQSAPVALLAGHRYYVEAQHVEIAGDDFVAVGWTLPDGTVETPIAGAHLMPFGFTAASAISQTAGANAAQASAADATSPTAAPGLSVYPNPFTRQTTLAFALPQAGQATLDVYDVQNRLVRRLFTGSAEAGERQWFTLEGAGLPVGVYLVRLVTSSRVYTQKLMRID
nr:T9SS type A sorting domain-containing protein [Hymenobacter sp. BRD128]